MRTAHLESLLTLQIQVSVPLNLLPGAGGNSGIGTETVKALATSGAKVIMTSRNVSAGEAVANKLTSEASLKVARFSPRLSSLRLGLSSWLSQSMYTRLE